MPRSLLGVSVYIVKTLNVTNSKRYTQKRCLAAIGIGAPYRTRISYEHVNNLEKRICEQTE